MIYGYARVSSPGQSLYGTSLETQEEELRARGATVVFKDVFTGTAASRPELDKLLSVIGSGDTLMVKKMDRLGRSAEDIIHLIKGLVARDVTVDIINMGIANNTMMGRLMVTVLAGMAEFEHDMILERFNDGKAARKASDPTYKEGRKPVVYDKTLYDELCPEVASGKTTVTEACERLGISRAKWYRLATA